MKNYIANGRYFETFEEVEAYAHKMGYRITNTETIRGKYIITMISK